MSAKGGLPPIDPYLVARHWWLNELRHNRARFKHGAITRPLFISFKRSNQKELCKARKEHYR